MPYLDDERKKFVDEQRSKATKEGDCNYLFTLALISAWIKKPGYATLHNFRKACFYDPSVQHEVWVIEQDLKEYNVSPVDIKIAKEMAFNEFMRRVGNKYEDKKIAENGDVYPEDVIPVIKKNKKGDK